MNKGENYKSIEKILGIGLIILGIIGTVTYAIGLIMDLSSSFTVRKYIIMNIVSIIVYIIGTIVGSKILTKYNGEYYPNKKG